MELKFFYLRQLYLLKQKVNTLSERDRILLLFITTVILLFIWYFTIARPELNAQKETKQQIQKVQDQISTLTQKKRLVRILISSPDTVKTIGYVKKLTAEVAKLDKEFTRYNERYITGGDLAKLLHDMLKQTMGVTIENFATFVPPVPVVTQQPGAAAPPAPAEPSHTTHYRLVIRGTYFPVMRYLERLEQLPWQLYWDKFDYTVSKYPEGVATVVFYTLKPHGAQQVIKQGSSQ